MTDAYIPVAANSTNLMELFNNSYYTTAPLSSEHVLFLCPIIATCTSSSCHYGNTSGTVRSAMRGSMWIAD
jgi:hypothetical protein